MAETRDAYGMRDGVEVHQEQVAAFTQAMSAALSTPQQRPPWVDVPVGTIATLSEAEPGNVE
jgi:hypothetical protein